MWTDAASNPNLLKFFKQAEEVGWIHGKYYGTICEPEECCSNFKVFFLGKYLTFHGYNTSDWGMTFLHLLEDLFEHDVILS